MINRVCLTGRLARDPDVRTTSNGKNITRFTLAVDKDRKDDGANFIDCIAFGKTGELIGGRTNKGMLIGIDGKLDQSTYQNREGKNVSSVSVIVQNFSFLESRHDQEKSNAYVARKQGYESNSFDEYKNSGYQGIENEDLPF